MAVDYLRLLGEYSKVEPSIAVATVVVYQALCRHHDLAGKASGTSFSEDLDFCLENYPEFSLVKPYRDMLCSSSAVDNYKTILGHSSATGPDDEVGQLLVKHFYHRASFFTENRLSSFIVQWLIEDGKPLNAYCPDNNLMSIEWQLRRNNIAIDCPQTYKYTAVIKSLLWTLQENCKNINMPIYSIDQISCGAQEYDIGFRLPEVMRDIATRQRSWDEICIDSMIANVKARCALILPTRFAFQSRKSVDNYRSQLVKSNRLQAVVRLPDGFCQGTSLSTVLLLLDNRQKSDTPPESILMIDLSRKDCRENRSTARYQTEVNDNAIDKLRAAIGGQTTTHSKQVSLEVLEANGWNLDPIRYVLTLEVEDAVKEIEKGTVQLKDVATISRAQMFRPDKSGKPYREVGATNINLAGVVETPEKITVLNEKNSGLSYRLHDKDIIFAIKGSVGRVGFIDGEPDNWVANQSFVIIRVVREGWAPEFLFRQLKSKAMQLYVSRLATGSLISAFVIDDLRSLPLQEPTPERLADALSKHKKQVELVGRLKSIQAQILELDD